MRPNSQQQQQQQQQQPSTIMMANQPTGAKRNSGVSKIPSRRGILVDATPSKDDAVRAGTAVAAAAAPTAPATAARSNPGTAAAVATAESDSKNTVGTKKVTSFSTVTIREYLICVGDNPGAVSGPALSIEWEPMAEITVPLNEYEVHRASTRRESREMIVPARVRFHMLRAVGYSTDEIVRATRPVNVVRKQRKRTLETLHLHSWHYLQERVFRGARNVLSGGDKKKKELELFNLYWKEQQRGVTLAGPTAGEDDEESRSPSSSPDAIIKQNGVSLTPTELVVPEDHDDLDTSLSIRKFVDCKQSVVEEASTTLSSSKQLQEGSSSQAYIDCILHQESTPEGGEGFEVGTTSKNNDSYGTLATTTTTSTTEERSSTSSSTSTLQLPRAAEEVEEQHPEAGAEKKKKKKKRRRKKVEVERISV
jgi:hypothetical protein